MTNKPKYLELNEVDILPIFYNRQRWYINKKELVVYCTGITGRRMKELLNSLNVGDILETIQGLIDHGFDTIRKEDHE